MRKKGWALTIVLLLLATLVVIYLCDKTVAANAAGRLFDDENKIPFNKVGLLLGTSKFLKNGYHNLYYDYRIEAAAKLLKRGKVKYLIISGDNSRKDYNEPALMRSDLIVAGIDSSQLFLDYAGFRTFDSIKRLKEVFSQDSITIISQQFHNERAIYIASNEKIDAVGFNAKDVLKYAGLKTRLREKLARVKVILDFWFGKKPKFLGSKIQIPA